MAGKHEQAAIERLRAASYAPRTALNAATDAEADLALASDIIGAMQAAAAMLLAMEAAEEEAKQCATRLRAALAEVMAETGATTVQLPHHSVALVEPKPRAVVTDPAALPAEFMEQPPPKPNLAAITKALRAGPVAGAVLSNGLSHIRISARRDNP